MSIIGALLASIWPYLIAAGGLIAALLGVYVTGRKSGADKSRAKAEKQRADNLTTAKETRDEVDSVSDDDVSERLRKWQRP
jgi:hypothetical protein